MSGRHTRPIIHGMAVDENSSLARLTALIEISIGQAHTILNSIEDITQLPGPADAGFRNRDSGYSEVRGSVDGSDLGRRLLAAERKVEDNRAYLRDLKRANLHGLQIIFEDPEALVIMELQNIMKTNFEASNELHRLAEYSPSLIHISKSRLEDILPPRVNISALKNRLSQIHNHWSLPFPAHSGKLCLCNSAKLLNSGTNKGVLGRVRDAQLRESDKQTLKSRGGSFQFWNCPTCDFHVRYHATHSNSLSIETADDSRRPGKGQTSCHITLRTVFLAKSHLHMQRGQPLRYACLFCTGNGKKLEKDSTAFANEDELATHIDKYHDATSLPRLFMMKLYVAAPEERPEGRCDIQFHRTRSAL